MKLHVMTLAAAGLLLAAANPAFATISSSAEVQLSIRLIDLDPTDQITPQISFVPNGLHLTENARLGTYSHAYLEQHASNSFSTVPDAIYTLDGMLGHLGFASDGDPAGMLGTTRLSVSGGTLGTPVAGSPMQYSSDSVLDVPMYSDFTLSGNTLAIFEAQVTLSAQATVGRAIGGGPSEDSSASYSMKVNSSIHPIDYNILEEHTSSKIIASDVSGHSQKYGPNKSFWRGLGTVSFSNMGTDGLQGTFNLSANASGYSSLVAVPEPSVWGLFAAGALVVAGVNRAARSKQGR